MGRRQLSKAGTRHQGRVTADKRRFAVIRPTERTTPGLDPLRTGEILREIIGMRK